MNIISKDYAEYYIIGYSVLLFAVSVYLSGDLFSSGICLLLFAGFILYMRSDRYSGIANPFFVIIAGQPFVFSLAGPEVPFGFVMEMALGLYYIIMTIKEKRDIFVFSAGIFLLLILAYSLAGYLNIYLYTLFAGGVLSAIFAAGVFIEHSAGKKVKRSD